MISAAINNEKNGVELRFDCKPEESILDILRDNGFRWSNKQKMWYAKQSPERMAIVNSLCSVDSADCSADGSFFNNENISEKRNKYDLWDLTRTDSIENNFEKYRIHDTKEIAAIIRKHIKSRFTMCKFSVTSDYHSIHIDILSGPFAKNSDELNAIADYVYAFAESYNYDNSDSMSDYFDVNFYGVYRGSIIASNYEQTEATVADANISALFSEKKAKYEADKREREEKEYQQRLVQLEIEKAESAKREEIRKSNHARIEAEAVVKPETFFVINCYDVVKEEDGTVIKSSRCNCKVQKAVYLTRELYDMIVDLPVADFSFYQNMGGSYTDDLRINSYIDYEQMSAEERETVEWYNTACVAIYCDDELKMVVDPQGHGYGKYVYYLDEQTEIKDKYTTYLGGLSDEEYSENLSLLQILFPV